MNKQDLKVGIITSADPTDKRSWSGTFFRMSNALKDEFSTVINLGPVRLSKLDYLIMNLQLIFLSVFHLVIFQKRFNREHNHIKSKYHCRFFDKVIQQNKIDILFAPSASSQIAYLKTNLPICHYSDTTLLAIIDYYDYFKKFSKKSIQISNKIEQKAINKSKTQVFSSKWALDSAKQDYGAKKTFLVKMGANIDTDPQDIDIIKEYESTINILFVGVDWKRKGGDIVLDTIDKLDKKGFNVQLIVIGCVPPQTHPKMKVIPFLNKNDNNDMLKFQEFFKKSHLFFMPTRAECYGIVFCEANAYGLPVITTDTGGVSSIIENGVNGFMLPFEAKSEEYYKVIADLISDDLKLRRMSETSRKKYLKDLNWKQWGKQMKEILIQTHAIGNKNDHFENL
ncbi:MAG: glycosyltransferase family 4 protein [Bacteroidia bacterium]|nr:glycosyltransferase family 4 protein [Bacteroidia bacterium]